MSAQHITDAGAYCWCSPRVEEGGALVIHRDAPEIAAEAKGLAARLGALREAVAAIARDPDVPMTDSVAEAVQLASADLPVDEYRLRRMLDNIRRHLDGDDA